MTRAPGRFAAGHRRARALIAALAVLAMPAPAAAAATGPSFAVEPLGPDAARGWFLFDAAAGRTVAGSVRIANLGDRTGSVVLYPADAGTGATSGAVYRLREDARRDVGAWLRLSASTLTLAPGQSQVVAFTIGVPEHVRSGDHLGGIVAQAALPRGDHSVRRGGRRFRIRVRSQTIVAAQVRVPGTRRPRLALTGVSSRGGEGRQEILLGIANDGNVLLKGSGRLRVTDAHDHVVQLDTTVPGTSIELPLAVRGRALAAGRYRATAILRYAGRTTRRVLSFTVSRRQARQVFGSAPGVSSPAATHELPWALLGLAALGLLGAGFGAAALLFRRTAIRDAARGESA